MKVILKQKFHFELEKTKLSHAWFLKRFFFLLRIQSRQGTFTSCWIKTILGTFSTSDTKFVKFMELLFRQFSCRKQSDVKPYSIHNFIELATHTFLKRLKPVEQGKQLSPQQSSNHISCSNTRDTQTLTLPCSTCRDTLWHTFCMHAFTPWKKHANCRKHTQVQRVGCSSSVGHQMSFKMRFLCGSEWEIIPFFFNKKHGN